MKVRMLGLAIFRGQHGGSDNAGSGHSAANAIEVRMRGRATPRPEDRSENAGSAHPAANTIEVRQALYCYMSFLTFNLLYIMLVAP